MRWENYEIDEKFQSARWLRDFVYMFCYFFWVDRWKSVHILERLEVLQNEKLLAKIGFDAAENEPSKV